MKVAVIRYNGGNTCSVSFALERLGVEATITGDPEEIRTADKVVFPGVGAAGAAMAYLEAEGMDKIICSLQQPVLGICLGMQLMCSFSEEGNTDCLGIFSQKVKRFSAVEKVPHMGWNTIGALQDDLFTGMPADSCLYFVHSYYVPESSDTIAVTDYIQPFSAAIRKNNFYGVQFHPEKSGKVGQQVLQNFLKL
ncbi:imidazole glycerol phosphate synthase subunit HisH [Chitinophagaceae bacterium MMS25-I14]